MSVERGQHEIKTLKCYKLQSHEQRSCLIERCISQEISSAKLEKKNDKKKIKDYCKADTTWCVYNNISVDQTSYLQV